MIIVRDVRFSYNIPNLHLKNRQGTETFTLCVFKVEYQVILMQCSLTRENISRLYLYLKLYIKKIACHLNNIVLGPFSFM